MNEQLTSADGEQTRWMFNEQVRALGGSLEYESVAIDIIGHRDINQKRKTDTDPYYTTVEVSSKLLQLSPFKKTPNMPEEKVMEEYIKPHWSQWSTAKLIYFPVHMDDHFMLLVVDPINKMVEIWDTLTHRRKEHAVKLKKLFHKLGTFLVKLDPEKTPRNMWHKFHAYVMNTCPTQEVGKNDCGAWVAHFLNEGLLPWRQLLQDHPGHSSQIIRFKVAMELLKKENWLEADYKKLVTDAVVWAQQTDD